MTVGSPTFCTRCGVQGSFGDRFCGQCGQPLRLPFRPTWVQGTPRGIDPMTGLELATWGRRAWAYVVDFFVVMIPLTGIAVGTGFAISRTVDHPNGTSTTGVSFVGALVIIVEVIACSSAYFGVLNGLTGRTVGMRLLGVEVRDASGFGLIGFWRAAGRFGILYGAFLIPLVGNLALAGDLLSPLWDRRRQAWHDHVFGSIVLRRPADPNPGSPSP
jgi:uncharacterized RDD family membrane protein YckC